MVFILNAELSKSETEFVDVVDTLERAISIVQNVMATDWAFLRKKIDEC